MQQSNVILNLTWSTSTRPLLKENKLIEKSCTKKKKKKKTTTQLLFNKPVSFLLVDKVITGGPIYTHHKLNIKVQFTPGPKTNFRR